jgi:hypothetical protein
MMMGGPLLGLRMTLQGLAMMQKYFWQLLDMLMPDGPPVFLAAVIGFCWQRSQPYCCATDELPSAAAVWGAVEDPSCNQRNLFSFLGLSQRRVSQE